MQSVDCPNMQSKHPKCFDIECTAHIWNSIVKTDFGKPTPVKYNTNSVIAQSV